MNEHNVKNNSRRTSIKLTLIMLGVLPALIVAVVMGYIAISTVKTGMQEEAINGLKFACGAVKAGYEAIDDGDYSLNDAGELVKGDFNLSKDETVIDAWTTDEPVDVTIFYGDTRMSTSLRDVNTNQRIIGTKASQEVIDTVLKNGKEYSSTDVIVNGKPYYAHYMPLYNDGNIVGMVFAGEPSGDVDDYISHCIIAIVIIAFILAAGSAVGCYFIAARIARAISLAKQSVDELSRGDLTNEVDALVLARRDELGEMGVSIKNMNEKLHDIIGTIQASAKSVLTSGDELQDMAEKTSHNASDVTNAVNDISQGANSQAEDIERATGNVSEMGRMIEQIATGIKKLNENSEEMLKTGADAAKYMKELNESNNLTQEAINLVSEKVMATDASVHRISQAVELISSIASQTNLLSLNASIEAARAGEAGRGFSVVASEISKLADESSNSANQINDIVMELLKDSQTSMEMMDKAREQLNEQQEKLTLTVKHFESVNDGIVSSRNQTDVINEQSEQCDKARVGVVDVIQNLSAISEENAAATQETNASMEQLGSTISVMAEDAIMLKELATKLEEATAFFKL